MLNSTERPLVTVITPTYNRAHTITDCWESLMRQTNHDFQWLVIDDGSNDNTKQVIEQLSAQSPDMRIHYVYKENGGKHTALNVSHPYIEGRYVLILDSDDTLTPNAVQDVISAWSRYETNEEINVIYFYKSDRNGNILAYVRHPNEPLLTYRERRLSSCHSRDCCDTFRTVTFIKHKFPVFPGERFIGEGAALLDIELQGKGVYVDKPICVCEYLTDGLTQAGRKMRLQNPQGGRYNSEKYMDHRLPFFLRCKNAMLYICYSFFAGASVHEALMATSHKPLVLLNLVPGSLIYRYWKRKFFGK